MNTIPVGLGTKLGALGTLALGVAALVAAVLDGDHSQETLVALAGAVITLCTTIAGRFAQAAAIYRAGGAAGVVKWLGEDDPPGGDVPTVPPGLRSP
jgi:hypothetical protein